MVLLFVLTICNRSVTSYSENSYKDSITDDTCNSDVAFIKKVHQKYFSLFLLMLEKIKNNDADSVLYQYFDSSIFANSSINRKRISISTWFNPVYEFFYKKSADDHDIIKNGYPITFPFDWNRNMLPDDPTWMFTLQNLSWLYPFIVSKNQDSLLFAFKVINDWILSNSSYPNMKNKFVFGDHSTAMRLQVFKKAMKIYRKGEIFDPDFQQVLLSGILSHIALMGSQEKYLNWHNHGIIFDMTLLEELETLNEFKLRDEVNKIAKIRLIEQFEYTFTNEGVHKEHSPCYHLYLLNRLNKSLEYFKGDESMQKFLSNMVNKAAEFYLYLLKPDMSYPNIGDCNCKKSLSFIIPEELMKKEISHAKLLGNNYRDSIFYILDEIKVFNKSGWAIFRSVREPLIHIVGQSDFYSWGHYQEDDMSFTLNVNGKDLIIDPGLYSYGKNKFAKYMRKSRAHNVLLVDNIDYNFNLKNTGLSGIKRSYIDKGDVSWTGIVEFTHPHYTSLDIEIFRQFGKINDTSFIIRDIAKTDSIHHFSRLFHLAPNAKLTFIQPDIFKITWDDFNYKIWLITKTKAFHIYEGEENPVQGWYFPDFGKKVSAQVLILEDVSKGFDANTFIIVSRDNNIPKVKKLKKKAKKLIKRLENIEAVEMKRHIIPEKWLNR